MSWACCFLLTPFKGEVGALVSGGRAEGINGFTLIEVLVALALVALSLAVFIELFASGLDRMHRVEDYMHLLVAKREIINELQMLNPASVNQGSGEVEGLAYSWRSKPKVSFRSIPGNDGNMVWKVGLFSIQVVLQRPRGGAIHFEIKAVGWQHL